ncbi:hypothetical protein, partial [Lysobacter sp. 22409]|uniref:hypothetical protein n=1 Tax=Lysobacter sp. 22409 TaxID=3453917 RepID=UPI003F8345CB
APGFFDRTSLSYRKTAHVLCAALRVSIGLASAWLRQALNGNGNDESRSKGRNDVSRDHELWMATILRRRRQVPASVVALALAVVVRRLALAKATEDPKGGLHGCRPFFIGTGMSRMKKPCVGIDHAGL